MVSYSTCNPSGSGWLVNPSDEPPAPFLTVEEHTITIRSSLMNGLDTLFLQQQDFGHEKGLEIKAVSVSPHIGEVLDGFVIATSTAQWFGAPFGSLLELWGVPIFVNPAQMSPLVALFEQQAGHIIETATVLKGEEYSGIIYSDMACRIQSMGKHSVLTK